MRAQLQSNDSHLRGIALFKRYRYSMAAAQAKSVM